MRALSSDEVDQALDNNGESEEGCYPVEMTVKELRQANASTCCGSIGNNCFHQIAQFDDRLVRGWFAPEFDDSEAQVQGMFHIECNEAEAQIISDSVGRVGGSLRPSGRSLWAGFWEFEIE